MAKKQKAAPKKHYTVAEANASLPLVRNIVRDITELFPELQERDQRLQRIMPGDGTAVVGAHREEVDHLLAEQERDKERLQEFLQELQALGIEFKDPNLGLIDFPCWMDDHEVYLCWRLGEPEVGHWHEIDAGFSGRKKLSAASLKAEAHS